MMRVYKILYLKINLFTKDFKDFSVLILGLKLFFRRRL